MKLLFRFRPGPPSSRRKVLHPPNQMDQRKQFPQLTPEEVPMMWAI